MLGNDIYRCFCNVFIVGNVEGEQGRIVFDQGDEASICEAAAVGEGQSLYSGADSERRDAAVIDFVGEGGKVESFDKVAVVEEGTVESEGLTDALVAAPVVAGGTMP